MPSAAPRPRRRRRGHTLLETAISASILVGMFGAGVSVFDSVAKAADTSHARLDTQSANQWALLDLVGDLQNSSVDELDELGQPRLSISIGQAPQPLVSAGTGDLGGYNGRLGGTTPPTHAHGRLDVDGGGSGAAVPVGLVLESNEGASRGAGQIGGSRWGRVRQTSFAGVDRIGQAAVRPRNTDIANNSVLRLQRVVGYGAAATGGVELTWSEPITYRVIGQRLVREQAGKSVVIASGIVAFQCTRSDVGTVDVTLVSQKRTRADGKVVYQANQISVAPRN